MLTNAKHNWMVRIATQYAVIAYFFISMILAAIQLTFILYFQLKNGFVKSEYYVLPYKGSVPWNLQTTSGWFAAFLIGVTSATIFILVNYTFLTFYIGFCLHHEAFYQQFKLMANQLNRLIITNSTSQNIIHKKTLLRKMIQFHISVIT